jgi:hypothetical protein
MSSKTPTPSQVAIALLCAGAFAFACGPRSHPEAASAASVASATPVLLQGAQHSPQAGQRSRGDDPRLASRLDIKVQHDGVDFALDVTNETKKHIELTFPNGQTHEFVVVDSVGREIWRWSSSRLFTQAVQNKLLSAGESMRVAERWEHPTRHGKYTAIATLNSTNYPVQERAEFVLP